MNHETPFTPPIVLDRLADLFDGTDTRVTCPFCEEADFDGPGLLSHMFRRCDGKTKSASDAEIVAALREAAAKARTESAS
jgi:hypothetical protein